MTEEDLSDDYVEYDEDPRLTFRKHRQPKQARNLEELVEAEDPTGNFETTYKPSRFERGWLHSSLETFYQQSFLRDVLYRVKGGKEATVYCGQGEFASGEDLIAVKVYRPREFRNLRNDAMYREGRPILTADGRAAKKTDSRLMRAVGKKTEFGVQVTHTSWLMYEYTTLDTLYRAGGAVPRPISSGENAILMTYQGDAQAAAPTLSEVHLDPDEAEPLFHEVVRNIELMLQQEMIHGDLSAYNILYWQGKITLIDFPQVTHLRSNANARFILQRDILRVCEYFIHHGVNCDPTAIMEKFWKQYAPT
ncbi:MAG TPA: RIO1 family regulatory kinase/ATPase [Chthonomonadaceae bacterium]|nr:RIO1 family regulatory kinase/ATPase [Chthonomonadaceae bacterium]